MDLSPPTRAADDGGHAGDLVFHLDELAAHPGQFTGEHLGHLGGGGDGVTGIEAATRSNGPQRNGLVALHQFDSHLRLLFQFPDHDRQVGAMGVTKMAGGTFFRRDHAGVLLSGVHGEDLGRAELHADAAAFTPLCVDKDLAAGAFFDRSRRYGLGFAWESRYFGHEIPFRNKDRIIEG